MADPFEFFERKAAEYAKRAGTDPEDQLRLKLNLADSANNDPRPKRALERVVPKQKHKKFKKEEWRK